MPTGLTIPEIDAEIAIIRDNLRELIEQATARSGGGDEELTADRIAGEETKLALLIRQRDAVL